MTIFDANGNPIRLPEKNLTLEGQLVAGILDGMPIQIYGDIGSAIRTAKKDWGPKDKDK